MTKEKIDEIIARAEKDGVFDDQMGDEIVRAWNKKNRIQKSRNFLERGIVPIDLVMYAMDEQDYYIIP